MTTLQVYSVAAVLIGGVVRLLKSDTPLPVDIPPRYRPFLALGLGVVASCVDMMARGTPWQEALVSGILAGSAAIAGHETIVEGLRGGKDFGVPRADA